jgi:hypothetical protein
MVGELDGDDVSDRSIIELCYGHVGAVAAWGKRLTSEEMR